ncbi:MAG: DUF2065 domain-containing protein [Pseudomonadota bacterium]|nr:DUF2065 domain-containing protein [Pseudomonadota bacterium]
MFDSFNDFVQVVCLVLIIEGLMPFIAPQATRKLMNTLASYTDQGIRLYGLGLLALGTLIIIGFTS